jgi:hypothetical protein
MSSGATAAKQRYQDQVEKADKIEPVETMQAGSRRYSQAPLPKVHEDKPGPEANLKTEDDAKGQFAPSQADSKATGVHSAKSTVIAGCENVAEHKTPPGKKTVKEWDINHDPGHEPGSYGVMLHGLRSRTSRA